MPASSAHGERTPNKRCSTKTDYMVVSGDLWPLIATVSKDESVVCQPQIAVSLTTLAHKTTPLQHELVTPIKLLVKALVGPLLEEPIEHTKRWQNLEAR